MWIEVAQVLYTWMRTCSGGQAAQLSTTITTITTITTHQSAQHAPTLLCPRRLFRTPKRAVRSRSSSYSCSVLPRSGRFLFWRIKRAAQGQTSFCTLARRGNASYRTTNGQCFTGRLTRPTRSHLCLRHSTTTSSMNHMTTVHVS